MRSTLPRSYGLAGLTLLACLFAPSVATAGPLRHGESNAELSVAAVSERTVRIALTPLDEKGKPRPGPASTALVELKPDTKLQVRELTEAQEVEVGKLRVRVKPDPLTITVSGPGDKVVQELVITEADGSVTFRTAAPVLGLGEGGAQFDRRGNLLPPVERPGVAAAAPLATHGGTIVVPFLIGTDGWALFVHRPFGEFDLRDGKGRFIPRKDTAGKEPLEVFVVALREPADALAEYYRLTGKPVMPPKWVMGYMQSHRTLAGPEEPVAIAKTFRDKKLPCDAVIYLGTGYCPAGWNVGPRHARVQPEDVPQARRDDQGAARPELQSRPAHQPRAAEHVRHIHRREVRRPDPHPQLLGAAQRPGRARRGRLVAGRRRRAAGRGAARAAPLLLRGAARGPAERPAVEPAPQRLRRACSGTAGGSGRATCSRAGRRSPRTCRSGVNYSLSLTPFWGTDIGGFVPTREFTGELYVRWFQFAAFNPLFRSHGRTWKLRLPWGWNTGEFGPGRDEPAARPGRAEERRGRADLQEVPRTPLPAAAVQLHAHARGVRHRPAADAGAVAALPRRPGRGEARRRVPLGPRPARRAGRREGRDRARRSTCPKATGTTGGRTRSRPGSAR